MGFCVSLRMPEIHTPSVALKKRQNRLKWALLSVWLLTSFGPGFFARDLAIEINGWPLYFWMAAQGSLLIFMAIVVLYAWLMNRWEAEEIAQLSAAPHVHSLEDTRDPH
jgi:putative solute:sodium symporter small subunit